MAYNRQPSLGIITSPPDNLTFLFADPGLSSLRPDWFRGLLLQCAFPSAVGQVVVTHRVSTYLSHPCPYLLSQLLFLHLLIYFPSPVGKTPLLLCRLSQSNRCRWAPLLYLLSTRHTSIHPSFYLSPSFLARLLCPASIL